jgi:hypothetical protein
MVLAAVIAGCAGATPPTPIIVYVTPPPTPIIVYVTPTPSEDPKPTPAPAPTLAPTLAPTPTPRPTAELVAGALFHSPKSCWEETFATDSEGSYSGGPVKLSVTVRNRGNAQSERLWMLIELRAPSPTLPYLMEQNWSNFSNYITVRSDDGGPYGAIWLPMVRLGPGKSFTYRATIAFEELGKAEYRVTLATGPGYDLSNTLSDYTEVRIYDGLSTVMRVC